MQHKVPAMFFIFLILFSIQAISQTTEKSLHPHLDKYYPQKNNTTITPPPAPTPSAIAETKPVSETKRVTVTQPLSSNNPVTVTQPSTQTNPLTVAKPVVETKAAVVVSDSTAINKPTAPAITLPEQKKIQPKKPSSIYMDTRLGGSSPLYDNYEKNSDGAGTITTSPKR